MNFSNYHNLPQPVVQAIIKAHEAYDSGDSDFTPSSLAKPPYIARLEKTHKEEMTVDVMKMLDAAVGTALHEMFENAVKDDDRYITEKRFYAQVGKWKIGGQIDLYTKKTGTLSDYKTTSSWAVRMGKKEWTRQGNINAILLRRNGLPVNGIEIIAYVKDHDPRKIKGTPGYPEAKLVVLPQDMWSDAEIEQGILYRCQLHEQAKMLPIDQVEVCTQDERWEKPTKWAVVRRGKARALKLFDFESDAKEYANEVRKGAYVEPRPGRRTRCLDWCTVSKWCRLHQEFLSKHNSKYEVVEGVNE